MKTNRMRQFLFLAVLALTSLSLLGQEPWDEGAWQNLRPEHYEDTLAAAKVAGPRRIGSTQTAPLKAYGVQRVPVVLVAFADRDFTVADTDEGVNEFYHKFCNGTMDGQLYKGHGSYGSIRDYFVEQSDSTFFPEFVVIGPVRLDSSYVYYGQNSASGARDVNYSKFRDEAIRKAMTLYEDWPRFDNNGDGDIDMVFLLFAGLGENVFSRDPNSIWPKESTARTTINGTVFATSATTCESRPDSLNADRTQVLRTKPDGVGVFVHELSHALGLPDFYDTNNKAFGMDLWSVMDYGEYGNSGYTPGNYTAYERDFMGWRRLRTLEEPCILTISCFADGGYGYRINNEANPENEYYIIENRQSRGWDTSIGRMGHGLQVTHVDFDQAAWNSNRVNTDPNHQRMTIIAANDNYTGTNATTDSKVWAAAVRGQLFPGDTYNYALTDETTPAAEVFTGVLMHKPLRNITENADGTVTLCFRTNGQLDVPVLYGSEDIAADQFDARWETVDYATRYVSQLWQDSLLIRQDTIAETTLHYDGLQPARSLKWRVRAMADSPEDYLESEWSDFAYLATLPDYIEGVPESDKVVDVFTLSGMRVSRCTADALNRLSLRRGVYVVRYSNGSAKRILIN